MGEKLQNLASIFNNSRLASLQNRSTYPKSKTNFVKPRWLA